jgi:hypothetical protein
MPLEHCTGIAFSYFCTRYSDHKQKKFLGVGDDGGGVTVYAIRRVQQ